MLALLGATVVTMQASADVLDSSGCSRGRVLNVVAHQDDDLLFMNPDIQRDIDANRCTLTVFVTAGDAGAGEGYWREREKGPRAAYAMMADADDEWNTKTVKFGKYDVRYESLADRSDVALVHLRAPDGGGGGWPANNGESLDELYQGKLAEIHSVDGANTYTKAGLIELLADVMRTFQPDFIQTLDYSEKNRGAEHSDHRTTAFLAFDAHRQYKTPHRISAYMAYAVADLPSNVFYTVENHKLDVFMAYAKHDSKVCQTTGACRNGAYDIRSFRRYRNAAEQGGVQNIAPLATLSVSSQNTAAGQSVAKAVNGSTKGSPISSADEWSTVKGKAGSWIYGIWRNAQTIDSVVLYDRPNANDQITAGVLSFSDGTKINVGALPNNGEGKVVSFPPKRLWSFKFTATKVSATSRNVGLAELQAFATTVAPRATVTASSQNTNSSQQAIRAVDGYTVGTGIGTNREWATTGGKAGSWLKLAWDKPQSINKVVLHDRPNGNDQITGGTLTFSDGSTVTVPALPNNGGAQTITFGKRTVTGMTFTVTKVSATTANVGLAEIQVETAR
ncbi:PIG-L family deacetylase [Actinoplanes sp. GCM10030250]|uniref:PIG-L family deacetylase n=1 Tax=Actinoplanes sp. GCM10030250 TaxID=3273376 RepID=UPI003619375A